jgi:hypothetical protein
MMRKHQQALSWARGNITTVGAVPANRECTAVASRWPALSRPRGLLPFIDHRLRRHGVATAMPHARLRQVADSTRVWLWIWSPTRHVAARMRAAAHSGTPSSVKTCVRLQGSGFPAVVIPLATLPAASAQPGRHNDHAGGSAASADRPEEGVRHRGAQHQGQGRHSGRAPEGRQAGASK